MKVLNICIADNDSIRAETIREALLEHGYDADSFKTETSAMKSIVEKAYDIIFLSNDFSIDPISFVNKTKSFSPSSRLVVINTVEADSDMPVLDYAELGVSHYVNIPISMEQIMDKVYTIEASVISEQDRKNLIIKLIDDAKSFAKGQKKPGTDDSRVLLKNVKLLSRVFNPSSPDEPKIRGDLSLTPYFDLIRMFSSIYDEGVLELYSENSSSLIILKNRAVVSVFTTPGIRGIKAFLRIAEWKEGSFNFKNKITTDYSVEHDIAYIDIPRLCSMARKARNWYEKYSSNIPPSGLTLDLDNTVVKRDVNITVPELDVLASVVEYKNVDDVINYNPRVDLDIFDSLISLRRKGFIKLGA